MSISDYDVEVLIREGENERVEFKQRLPRIELLARDIAAFANSGGGCILVGVNDNGPVVAPDANFRQNVERAVARLHPAPPVNVRVRSVRDSPENPSHVGVIEVQPGDGLVMAPDGAFHRVGTAIRPMESNDILAVLRPPITESIQTVTDFAVTLADLTKRIDGLHEELAAANTPGARWRDYVVGGLVGAVISAIVAGLIG